MKASKSKFVFYGSTTGNRPLCFRAHCHGQNRFHDSIEGNFRSIEYSLVSGDYLRWTPKKLLD